MEFFFEMVCFHLASQKNTAGNVWGRGLSQNLQVELALNFVHLVQAYITSPQHRMHMAL